MSKRRIPYPPVWLSGVVLLLAALSLFPISRIHFKNDFETMVDKTTEEAKQYDEFVKTFGNDEFIVIAMTGKDLFAEDALDAMLETLKKLEKSQFIVHVDGIPAVFRDRFGAEDPKALKDELTGTPFYKNLFISHDAKVGGIMAQLKPLGDEAVDDQLLQDIRDAVKPLEEYGFKVHLVGGPVMSDAISSISESEGIRTFSLAAVVSLGVLFFLVRSFRGALTVVICGALAMVLTYGVIGLTTGQLNVVTASLPPIMWVLMIANCVFLVCRYQFHRSQLDTSREAAHVTLDEVWLPCTLAVITMIFGFISLATAELRPVQEFGIFSSVGMLFSLLVTFIVGPHLLVAMHTTGVRWQGINDGSHYLWMAEFSIRRPYIIIGIYAFLTGLGMWSATQLRVEPNPLALLPDDSETVEAYRFVARELTGFYAMEMVIDTPGGWTNPEYWKSINGFIDRMQKSDLVARTMSPLDFLRKVNQWDHDIDPAFYKLPDTRAEAERLVSIAADSEDKGGVSRLATPDGNRIRVSVLLKTTDSLKLLKLVDQAAEEMKQLPAPMKGIVTGLVPRMQGMQIRLIESQMNSFGSSCILISLCILVGLRSIIITGVSVLPNIMPTVCIFTVMLLCGIPLDAATVMVASISMGMAVDNCVHFLAVYREEILDGATSLEAIRRGVMQVGPPLTTTTLVGSIGFFALVISKFKPMYYFGLLSGMSMILALSAPLFFIPAVMSLPWLHMDRYIRKMKKPA